MSISACQIDYVTLTSAIPDQNYVINSGELVIQSAFKSAYNCPLSYSLTSNLPQGSPVSAVLDQVTGSVKIMATDLTLDGK